MKHQSILKMSGILGIILASSQAYAICPAAPVGTAADPVLQLKLNADSNSSFGAANVFDSTEEGALVWNDAANVVAYCDGTNWVNLGGGGGDADTLDGIDSSSFVRSDANDDINAHTEWQDNMDVRLGTDADFRMDFNGTNTIMRSYAHGAQILLQGEDAGGTNRTLLTLDPNGNTHIYYQGEEKLRTVNAGVDVSGTVIADDAAVGNSDADGALTVTGGSDIAAVNTVGQGSIVLQDSAANTSGWKLRLDPNEMQASNNNAPGSFAINPFGGPVYLGSTSAAATISIRGNRLQDVANPTASDDAATKAYVDAQIGGNTNADTVDGFHASSFLRSNADDSTTGNLAFTSGHGKGLKFWNSDSYKIYMSAVSDATWGGNLDGTSDYNMYFRMNGGTNRGFVFRNNTTNVAQIDANGTLWMTGSGQINNPDRILLKNKEPDNLGADGELAFDSSRGLILYRTQTIGDESGAGGYTVLDTSNIAAGPGITLTNTASTITGTQAITIGTANVDATTVDGLDSSAFIRANANDNVTGHTEWQDNMQVRLGNDADFRIFHDATNHVIRGYTHGTPIYIQAENGSGTNRTMIFADPDNKVSLYHAGAVKLETSSAGVIVNGRITGLSDPTAAQNAATKSYVDTRVDDRRMTCTTVRWDQGLERPASGGNRYMVYNDAISVNRRCQELGYAMGVPRDTFTHAQWCVYANARTARWQQGAWVNMACQSSASVEEARCCKN